jgi:hypothetical protein
LQVFSREPTNPYGINKLLLSIVDKDMDETIIIEMAAENPQKTPVRCQKQVNRE